MSRRVASSLSTVTASRNGGLAADVVALQSRLQHPNGWAAAAYSGAARNSLRQVGGFSHETLPVARLYWWRRQDRIDCGLVPDCQARRRPSSSRQATGPRPRDPAKDDPAGVAAGAGAGVPKTAVRGHRGDCHHGVAGAGGVSRAERRTPAVMGADSLPAEQTVHPSEAGAGGGRVRRDMVAGRHGARAGSAVEAGAGYGCLWSRRVGRAAPF